MGGVRVPPLLARLRRPGYRLTILAVGFATVGALVIPILVFGSFARGTVDSDLAQRAAAERVRAATLSATLVDRELAEMGRQLQLLATRVLLMESLRERDGAALVRHLASLRAAARRSASAAAFDARGILLARDPWTSELIGQDFSRRDYFIGGLSAAGAFVSEAYVSQAPPYATLVAVSHVVRQENETLGLVQMTLAPRDVIAVLEPIESSPGREILVLDRQQRVVASTDQERTPLSSVQLPELSLTSPQAAGTTTVTLGGAERIVTYAPLPSTSWVLYVVDDPNVALAPERQLSGQLAGATAIAVMAAAVAAILVAFLFAMTARQRLALAQANERLGRASRAKSEFLSSMSHELRTPLNAILGFSALMREQLADQIGERHRRYLQNIHDAGEHLLALINDVLDLAKVEAGRIELRRESTMLGALVEPVVASARALADPRGVAFEATVLPIDGVVDVDAGRLRQVLYNLLSNAVKFTPAGGRVGLQVRLEKRDLAFEVSDTGIGIPADKRDRVFGLFERLHEGTSDATGTGLGLALTKQLVELHGGAIGFTSEAGDGTRFWVRIPDALVEVARGDRILIVDDEEASADLVAALVAGAGFSSEIVRTARGALDAIRRDPPLAVVLDLRLPDERGERVLEAIKADPVTRHIPVVVVTVEDDEGHLRPLGAADHLTKPFDRARFVAWLRSMSEKEIVRARPAR